MNDLGKKIGFFMVEIRYKYDLSKAFLNTSLSSSFFLILKDY